MTTKLHVGNLDQRTTMDDLQNYFNRAGLVLSASISMDTSGASQGFGYVIMSTEDGAQAAISSLNGFRIHDRDITVREARANE